MKKAATIEVKPDFLAECAKIRKLLWKAGELIDDLGVALMDSGHHWSARTRTKYERVQAEIAKKRSEWSPRGTRG